MVLSASAAISGPLGELQRGYGARDLGAGFGASFDAAFGLSRVIAIGAWAQVLTYSNSSACRFWHLPQQSRDPCSATSVAFGPLVRYHLLQGMRFDPWLVIGPGYRRITQETPAGTKTYAGVEWLHVVIGGDYYLLSGVGIGPWVAIDGGVFTKRPRPFLPRGAPHVKTAWHTEFVTGLRLVLDIPGK